MQDDYAEQLRALFLSTSDDRAFDELLEQVSDLADTGDRATLEAMERLARALPAPTPDAPHPAGREIVRFDIGALGEVTRVTAAAVDDFALEPGAAFADLLTEAGRRQFEAAVEGRGERLVTAPLGHGGRPTLVALRAAEHGVAAQAFVSLWRPAIAETLRLEFGLTGAEVDVARGLFDGLAPKDVARLRDRSLETVRSQIRSLYRKTGARGVLDLTHLIHDMAAYLGQETQTASLSGLRRTVPTARGGVDVLVQGPRRGRPLLFLHGCLGGRRLVDSAMARLSEYLIVAPGRRGHGRTALDDVAPSAAPAGDAADALAIMDSMDIGRFDVLAYDVGAATALTLAAAAADRIGRVTLVAALPPMPRFADVMALPRQQRVFPLLSRIAPAVCRSLAGVGGESLLAAGPGRFARTVFAGAPVDIAACRDPAVAAAFWRGHAWHTRLGPGGFVRDATVAATAWDGPLPELRPRSCMSMARTTSARRSDASWTSGREPAADSSPSPAQDTAFCMRRPAPGRTRSTPDRRRKHAERRRTIG